MPITAFEMAQIFENTSFICIERDDDAFLLGKQVAEISAMRIEHVLADAATVDFGEHDVIFLASMVENKKEVLDRIALTAKRGTLVGVRSVEALRHTLYTPVVPSDIPAKWHFEAKTAYRPEHINTTLFYRVS